MAGKEIAMRDEDTKRLNEAIQTAEDEFWGSIATSYPEARAGDFPPEAHIPFRNSIRDAVIAWIDINVPKKPRKAIEMSATAEICVMLRVPKKGERAIWILDPTRNISASDAVARVINRLQLDGDPWWIADVDWRDGEEFDDDMRVVTISFRPSPSIVQILPPNPNRQVDVIRNDTDQTMHVRADGTPMEHVTMPGPVMSESHRAWSTFVGQLGKHGDWSATYEYPGIIAWHHPNVGFNVFATPDYNREGWIDIQLSTNDGSHIAFEPEDIHWPNAPDNRTPAIYKTLMAPVLDKIVEFAKAGVKCPACGNDVITRIRITERYRAFHTIRGHNAKQQPIVENTMRMSCPVTDDGDDNFIVVCDECDHLGDPADFGLGDPSEWDWVS